MSSFTRWPLRTVHCPLLDEIWRLFFPRDFILCNSIVQRPVDPEQGEEGDGGQAQRVTHIDSAVSGEHARIELDQETGLPPPALCYNHPAHPPVFPNLSLFPLK